MRDLDAILRQVAEGSLQVDAAAAQLRGYADLGYAAVDLDRARRRGQPEIIFGQGKTPEQIAGIARRLHEAGQRVLATRVEADCAAQCW